MDIYDKINMDEQDENTGKSLLKETKDLLNKFYSIFTKTLDSVIANPESPHEIPEELFNLKDKILKNAMAYGKLPAVSIYEEVGRKGMFDKNQVRTRSEWFEKGKPTNEEWFKKWKTST